MTKLPETVLPHGLITSRFFCWCRKNRTWHASFTIIRRCILEQGNGATRPCVCCTQAYAVTSLTAMPLHSLFTPLRMHLFVSPFFFRSCQIFKVRFTRIKSILSNLDSFNVFEITILPKL